MAQNKNSKDLITSPDSNIVKHLWSATRNLLEKQFGSILFQDVEKISRRVSSEMAKPIAFFADDAEDIPQKPVLTPHQKSIVELKDKPIKIGDHQRQFLDRKVKLTKDQEESLEILQDPKNNICSNFIKDFFNILQLRKEVISNLSSDSHLDGFKAITELKHVLEDMENDYCKPHNINKLDKFEQSIIKDFGKIYSEVNDRIEKLNERKLDFEKGVDQSYKIINYAFDEFEKIEEKILNEISVNTQNPSTSVGLRAGLENPVEDLIPQSSTKTRS